MAANGSRFTRASAGDMLVPVGFRFHPTDDELVHYYLQMKLEGMDYIVSDVISEINICNHEPRDLPGLSLIKSDDQEWYFFSTYKKNSKNQTERATKEGFWKITGTQKEVKTQAKRTIIGKKRILTFYRGHVRNSQKTNWVMHEYYIPQTNPNDNQRDLVVCCVKKRSGENVDAANCHERESGTYNNASDFENQQLLALGMDIEEEHTQQQQSKDYFERAQCRMLSAHGNNDYHGLQSAFAANERDENLQEFVNSLLVPGDQDSSGEITHANVFNDSIKQSIRGVYFEDGALNSDTDTEVLLALDMSLQMLSEPPVDSSHPRRQEGVMLCQKQAASSVNVVPNLLVTDEHSGTHRQLVYDEHKQQQSKAKEAAERRAAVDFPPKKTSITKSNKEAEVAQGNNAEKCLKQTQNATTAGNWKQCFISWETSPPLTSPPSVYLFNMVVGVIMFCVFAREAVLYGQWC